MLKFSFGSPLYTPCVQEYHPFCFLNEIMHLPFQKIFFETNVDRILLAIAQIIDETDHIEYINKFRK